MWLREQTHNQEVVVLNPCAGHFSQNLLKKLHYLLKIALFVEKAKRGRGWPILSI